jgi:hypothetical protein
MCSHRIIAILVTIIFWACSDTGVNPIDLQGTYQGTFTITHSTGLVQSGKVTFTFTDGRYTCVPETRYLPPSGAGSFVMGHNTISLTDTVPHTAEFDWTLILGGEFAVWSSGSHPILVQDDQKYQRHRTIDLIQD